MEDIFIQNTTNLKWIQKTNEQAVYMLIFMHAILCPWMLHNELFRSYEMSSHTYNALLENVCDGHPLLM